MEEFLVSQIWSPYGTEFATSYSSRAVTTLILENLISRIRTLVFSSFVVTQPALLVTPMRKCEISPMMYPVVIRNKKFRLVRVQSEDLVFIPSGFSELILRTKSFSHSSISCLK